MKTKYTPGPWHVADNDGAHCIIRGFPVPQLSNGQTIAKVWLTGDDFSEADARLIAAAPEMLAMLQSASTLLHKLYAGVPPSAHTDQIDMLLARINRLTHKAEGNGDLYE